MINKIKNLYKNNLKFNILIYMLILTSALAYMFIISIYEINKFLTILIGLIILLLTIIQSDKVKRLIKVVKLNEKENKTDTQ